MNTAQESKIFEWYFLLPSIVAGLFSLIGSYFGAKLYRQSQHNKIIDEYRIQIINDFIKIIDLCVNERARNRDIPYHLIFQPADSLISNVKLYLKNKDKNLFEKHVRDYIHNYQHSIKFNREPHDRADPSLLMKNANDAKCKMDKILNSYI